MLGFGALKQMNDTLKQNRAMLGKKKSLREIYKEEIKNRISTHDNIDLNALRRRIADRQRRNFFREAIVKGLVVIVAVGAIIGGIWIFRAVIDFSVEAHPPIVTEDLFKTVLIDLPDSLVHKIEFYSVGPKAATGYLKRSMKHQNYESYYSSGEQFRSALYFYDSIVVDYYFYKWGDTIKNFPKIYDNKIHHVTLTVPEKSKVIEFDFYDGKTILGTYTEKPIEVYK